MICHSMRALAPTRYSVQPKFTKQTTGRFNSSRRLPNPENALCANFILNCKRQARKNHPSLFNKNGKSQSSRSNFFKKNFYFIFHRKRKKKSQSHTHYFSFLILKFLVQILEKQLLTVAKAVEEKLDEEIAAIDRLDDDDLEALRERRLQQMKKMAEKRNRWISLGHGDYSEIQAEKDFFSVVKASDRVVCHFYRENWPCKVSFFSL